MNNPISNSRCPLTPTRGVIRSIIPMASDNTLFQITVDGDALSDCMPGQFVQLWVPGVGESPISVCSGHVGATVELTVRKVGRVTSALFQMNEGDWVGLRGPYGNGFPVEAYRGKDLCLIAGGLGVAPIRSLWQYVLDHREDFGKITLIYGMRHSIDLLFRSEFKMLLRRRDMEVFIAAEELCGPALPPISVQLGRVTDMIKAASLSPTVEVAVCGPPVMYKYVIDELKAKGIAESQIWLSLERHMKCGIGKCGHCFVGGAFACKAGPVFNLPQLRLLPEAVECA
ncbi:MAG: oxidoreductase [Candidatus Melainabacteria bacterium]|nr:MAG: oxidoreductase [Candidatus Melainabacteria bacterium]